YVQVHLNGNSRNNGNHVYEIEVWGSPALDGAYWASATNTITTPEFTRTNLARTATVTGTGLVEGYLVNDGDTSIQTQEYAYIGAGAGSDRGPETRYFELDLGASRTIYSVDTHFYSNDSRHYWYKIAVSQDGQNWTYLAGNSSNQGWMQ